jgi:iron(III) transport system ATP-binding protein
VITIRQLKKSYVTSESAVQALRSISFRVNPEEFYTLLGPSGCGKTTTLRCIAGLEMPEEGEIHIAGRPVFSRAQRIQIPADQREIGMVFQSYAVWPHMTVFDNVAFPLVHGRYRLSRTQVNERVTRTLRLVQLNGLESRPVPLLSGGQQQRVALARALVYEPKVLLLDEPLSNLDAKLREQMRVEIKQLAKKVGITVLYVTHDQVEALSMSDRIAVMNEGKIVQEGTPREIYFSPSDVFTAGFIGKVNLIEGKVARASRSSDACSVATPLGLLSCFLSGDVSEGDEVIVALRPDGLKLCLEKPDKPDNTFAGKVEMVNFLGDLCEVHVRVNERLFVLQVEPRLELDHHQDVFLYFPPDRCFVVKSKASGSGPSH